MEKTKEIFRCHSTCCTSKVLQQGARYICFQCCKECEIEGSKPYCQDALSHKHKVFRGDNNI